MNLFGLEGSGFIISLGITLLLSGLIMYYCVQRMNQLSNSLVKQGEIIQTFIYKLNNLELQYNSNNVTTNLNNQLVEDKINVSDDDDVSDDDVSDDDGEDSDDDNKQNIKLLAFDGKTSSNIVDIETDYSDSESDEETDEETHEENINNATNSKNNSDIQAFISNNLIASSESSIEKMDTVSFDSSDKNSSDNITLNDKIDDDSKKIIELSNDIEEHVNYNKLKVTELKELAIKKNLVKSNDTTKYKKDELIQLLQK